MNNSNNSRITVIIVFLNEGIEVENTVKSIREHSSAEQVDILLINDASDDGYDYRIIANKYKTGYYKNEYRRGVALSRLDGVNLCMTEFFILLDAHMRVYNSVWADILIANLKKQPRCVFCCQTIPLTSSGIPEKSFSYNYGAYIDFDDFSVNWNSIDIDCGSDTYPIPCILGASYASSKSYWIEIKGGYGLKTYGFEEQLVSIKSWMAGNGCALLKSVEFGHIYRKRKNVPYEMFDKDFMYNKIFAISIFFGIEKVKTLYLFSEKEKVMADILKETERSRKEFLENRWNKNIFNKDISLFLNLNNKVKLLQPV